MSNVPVFHPGHDELHGITVVLFTEGPKTYVGRWDSEQNGTIHMNDVSVHDTGGDDRSRDQFLRDTKKYGPAVNEKSITVARAEVTTVTKLGELQLPDA